MRKAAREAAEINDSGAPAREERVGQSPILMEYDQPLFA